MISSKKLPGISITDHDSLELVKDAEGNNKYLLWWHTAHKPMKILDPGDPCSVLLDSWYFQVPKPGAPHDDIYLLKNSLNLEELEERHLYNLEISPSIMCSMCARHVWIHYDEVSNIFPYGGISERFPAPPEELAVKDRLKNALQKLWN